MPVHGSPVTQGLSTVSRVHACTRPTPADGACCPISGMPNGTQSTQDIVCFALGCSGPLRACGRYTCSCMPLSGTCLSQRCLKLLQMLAGRLFRMPV